MLIRLRCRQRRADTPRRSRPRAVGFKRLGKLKCGGRSPILVGMHPKVRRPTGSVMCNLYSMTNAIRDLFNVGRHHRQPAAAAGDLSGSDGSRRLRQRRRARIDHDALGHAEPAAFPGNEHPQHQIATLAAMACAGKPVPRARRPLNVIHGNDRFTKFNKARGNSPDRS